MYNYTQEQARPGVHFHELGEIDARQGNVIIGDDFGADYLERKKSYRESLTRFFATQVRPLDQNQRPPHGKWRFSLGTSRHHRSEKSEEELQLARRQAEATSQAKTEFLTTITHELRTSLTSIHGSLGLLASGAVGELTRKNWPRTRSVTANA